MGRVEPNPWAYLINQVAKWMTNYQSPQKTAAQEHLSTSDIEGKKRLVACECVFKSNTHSHLLCDSEHLKESIKAKGFSRQIIVFKQIMYSSSLSYRNPMEKHTDSSQKKNICWVGGRLKDIV